MTGSNIIDLSHHNGPVDLQKAQADGIAGVIHKATQGLTYVAHMFATNCRKAAAAGPLFGAYHFGTCADGSAQADCFLQTVQPSDTGLLVLDFEENTAGATMTLDRAATSSQASRASPIVGPVSTAATTLLSSSARETTPC